MTTFLPMALTVLGAANQVGDMFATRQPDKYAERQRRLLVPGREAEDVAKTEEIRRPGDRDEASRRDRLRRILAKQRASFAASGVAAGGSADAVLGNLQQTSTIEGAEEREDRDAALEAVTRRRATRRGIDLLDRSSWRTKRRTQTLGQIRSLGSLLDRF